MAQAALLEYEDEVQKLCNRLQQTEHKSREQGPKQTVFSELESVKSDTATLATQVSQMLDFVPAVDRFQGNDGSEIESLRIQNIELAHQLQSYVPQEDVEQLETELFNMKTDHEKLIRELNLFKDDKRRLQSELVQAQEEVHIGNTTLNYSCILVSSRKTWMDGHRIYRVILVHAELNPDVWVGIYSWGTSTCASIFSPQIIKKSVWNSKY